MFLAHAPISFLANELIQKKKISKLKSNEKVLIGIAGLFFGVFPDIDMLVLLATTTPTFMHHTIFTHAPLFYIFLWLILKLLYKIFWKYLNKDTQKILNPEFVNVLLNTFLIATLFHLLADIFTENIMLFYPFSTQQYSIFKYALQPSLFGGYFFSVSFGLEMLACTIFFAYLSIRFFKKSTFLEFLNMFFIICGSLFLIFTFYSHLNTYNSSNLFDSAGTQNYDEDYDTLSDGMDMDVDNDGVDNILDVDTPKVADQTQIILDSKKWTIYSSNSAYGLAKFEAGGLNSYRLIAQAYWNLHSPISPVLKDMLTKEGSVTKYSWNFNYLSAFYQYFNTKGLLVEQVTDGDITMAKGTLFFVLDSEQKLLNAGIALNNGELGTVLPYDERTTTHTYQELRNYYGDNFVLMATK